eukprot:g18940.t1
MGCGRAALRRCSSSSGGGSSRAVRLSGGVQGARQTSESRPGWSGQLFSTATPPRGAVGIVSVPRKGAPFSALAMGQQLQQGAARDAIFGKGTGMAMWETVQLAMTKQRRIPLLNISTNLSNQCGHMSFVILALAYLETDVLALR